MGQGESRQQYEEELNRMRRQERERAATELNNAIGKVESQFQQELKKLSDANSKREKEQQEVINKLQQQEKKCSSTLAETQQQLGIFDKRVGQLETQVLEEQQLSASRKRRAEELEDDIRRVTKELESEKAEREEALAKISALEGVINATAMDLDCERQRLKGAREKIMNLEKQLRAFCTTAEAIKHLFEKQQENLEAMHKALQEKQSDQINASTEAAHDPNHQITQHNANVGTAKVKETDQTTSHTSNGNYMEPDFTSSVEREGNNVGVEASSDDEMSKRHIYDRNKMTYNE